MKYAFKNCKRRKEVITCTNVDKRDGTGAVTYANA